MCEHLTKKKNQKDQLYVQVNKYGDLRVMVLEIYYWDYFSLYVKIFVGSVFGTYATHPYCKYTKFTVKSDGS